jgi:serine protease Do
MIKAILRAGLLGIILFSFIYLVFKAPQIHRNYIYKTVGPKVVEVVAFDPITGQLKGGGTGWAIKVHGKSYIITNRHVCRMYDGNYQASIKLNNGSVFTRNIIAISPILDLCAIEGIEELGGLGLASGTYIGEIVSVVGHPMLLPLNVAYGAILEQTTFSIGWEGEQDLVYLSTCQIMPGNSGSPVVNYRGQVMGVAFAADSDVHWGLIIPLEDLKYFLGTLP